MPLLDTEQLGWSQECHACWATLWKHDGRCLVTIYQAGLTWVLVADQQQL